jgi:dTDP-4-dehydrorhamnose 3,5-epimerase
MQTPLRFVANGTHGGTAWCYMAPNGRSQQRRVEAVDFRETSIPGVVVFAPTPHRDERGFFSRTFDAAVARQAGVDPDSFLQDSISRSRLGVIRGLHTRVGRGEGKLVRCSSGAVFDVVVDLRPGSPTFGQWLSFDLDGDNQVSVYIPAGCAHGFQALADPADVAYRIDREHDPAENLTIAHDDPDLAIPWPLAATILSEADRAAQPLAALGDQLRRIAARTP